MNHEPPDQARPTHRLGIGLLLFGAVMALFLVPLPVDPHHRKLFNLASNAAHLPLLGAFSIGLYWLGFARRSLIAIAVTGCLTAALVEMAQAPIGRTPSWTDFNNGCLGIACALAGILAWRSRGSVARLAHALVTLTLFAVVGFPAWQEWRAVRWQELQFPLLADFEDERDVLLFEILGGTEETPSKIGLTDEFAFTGDHSLRVQLGAGGGHRPGLHYAAGSKDWTGYRELRFVIHNPDTPFRLGLMVDDGDCFEAKTCYAKTFQIGHGLNEFRLPLEEISRGRRGRPLDLTEITRLIFFPRIGVTPRVYHLDGLRLE